MDGLALIELATSLPELSSITTALRLRRCEITFGQVLGTNFINLSLILLADAVFRAGPVINELSRFETTSTLLGAVLTGVFLIGLLERRNPTVMKMGWDSLAEMVLFVGGLVLLYAVEYGRSNRSSASRSMARRTARYQGGHDGQAQV